MDPLELRKVGRPKRQLGDGKRRLFCTKSQKVVSQKICSQYKRRKERQKKTATKTLLHKAKWSPKIVDFLETHSRIMPNEKTPS